MSEDQPNRDDELQQRKRELEEELDRYAQAGIASPNVVKAARWVSRFLYFAMAALVMYLLISGWGSVSKSRHEEVVKKLQAAQEETLQARRQRDEVAARYAEEVVKGAVLRAELADFHHPAAIADRLLHDARKLVDRFYGERAYAAHWRERAERAEPGAHGIEPVAGARNLLRQAAHGQAAVRFEVLRLAGADFGLQACREAALDLLDDLDPPVRAIAALVYARASEPDGAELLAERALAEQNERIRREIWLAWATLGEDQPPAGVWYSEAWVGYCVRTFDPLLDDLLSRYAGSPEEFRVELLALIAVAAGSRHESQMREIAVSTARSEAQRIIAVRWFADRKEEGGRDLLQSLSAGEGPVATEAEEALKRFGVRSSGE